MIALVGIGEDDRLKSCLETRPDCSGMTEQISNLRRLLAVA